MKPGRTSGCSQGSASCAVEGNTSRRGVLRECFSREVANAGGFGEQDRCLFSMVLTTLLYRKNGGVF